MRASSDVACEISQVVKFDLLDVVTVHDGCVLRTLVEFLGVKEAFATIPLVSKVFKVAMFTWIVPPIWQDNWFAVPATTVIWSSSHDEGIAELAHVMEDTEDSLAHTPPAFSNSPTFGASAPPKLQFASGVIDVIMVGRLVVNPEAPAAFMRVLHEYSAFFEYQVEIFYAKSDPLQRTLYKSSEVCKKLNCTNKKLAMWLARRRSRYPYDIVQAKCFELGSMNLKPHTPKHVVHDHQNDLSVDRDIPVYMKVNHLPPRKF